MVSDTAAIEFVKKLAGVTGKDIVLWHSLDRCNYRCVLGGGLQVDLGCYADQGLVLTAFYGAEPRSPKSLYLRDKTKKERKILCNLLGVIVHQSKRLAKQKQKQNTPEIINAAIKQMSSALAAAQ
jgi:hypothetical protein